MPTEDNTIKNLIAEKNKHAQRLDKLEEAISKKTLSLDSVKIGNIVIIGSGEHQGMWTQGDDGSWNKANI